MSNNNMSSVFGNSARYAMEGQVDISAAAAVSAYRGDGVTVAKTATGRYKVTVKNPGELKLVKVLNTQVTMQDASVGTVKDVGCVSMTQNATTGAFEMTIRTVDAAGADVDEATDALTVSFAFVLQTARMTNPLD